jgi:hypothetical protein
MITAIVRLETSDLWPEREGVNPEREVLWFVPDPEARSNLQLFCKIGPVLSNF